MKASESRLLLAVEFQINPFGREITGAVKIQLNREQEAAF